MGPRLDGCPTRVVLILRQVPTVVLTLWKRWELGTHGVFPKCDLTCSPRPHSKDANKIRVDGAHAVAQVDAQMSLLEAKREPWRPRCRLPPRARPGRERSTPLSSLSFATHSDSLMRGRVGIPRPRTEVELNPFRATFVGVPP